jgi:thiamine-phosphate pyrophosphorylase
VTARLVIVTDRRQARDLPAQLDAMLAAIPPHGAIVQVREKDLGGAALLAITQEVVDVARDRARVLVNDRLDVALAAGADGVHLPENGMPIADARALGARIVGCSRHSPAAARAALAAGADLVLLGPIYATPSKAAYGAPLGVGALAGGARVYAIGGIETAEQAAACRAAGADGVAAIRALWTAPDPGAVARALFLAAQGE